jgi:hypothetical protein
MADHRDKLLSVASEPILRPPEPVEMERLDSIAPCGADLFEMLRLRNGWNAFESALHVFPLGKKHGVLDLETWNSDSLWRNDFQGLANGCFFFAEDIFGVQFCYKEGQIQTFNPETGETRPFAGNLAEWTKRILDDYKLHTGYPLAHEWQKRNRPLIEGERLFPRIPFVLQGSFTVDNLYALDCVEGMKVLASIATQIRNLPDGARVKLRVIPQGQ